MININSKILSIPPFISTSWKNIALLHVNIREQAPVLIVTLINGSCIEIPHLEKSLIDTVFTMHAKAMESENSRETPETGQDNKEKIPHIGIPLPVGAMGIEHLGAFLQHSPESADSPNLPEEVLSKISSLSQMMGIEDPSAFPKAEPHCNCFHCQIARALHGEAKEEEAAINPPEEAISDADLKFRLWDVRQTAEKLYIVTNPEDDKEHYSVFLGTPIGCTCGEGNCAHVHAVLHS